MKFFYNFFLALCLVLFTLASSVDATVDGGTCSTDVDCTDNAGASVCSNSLCYAPLTDSNFRTACVAWVSSPGTATTTYGLIADWNTGEVTDMSTAFDNMSNPGANAFNDDISQWDTSSVTTMAYVSVERIICS
jgi:surface protein